MRPLLLSRYQVLKSHEVLKIQLYASTLSLIYRALQYNILWKEVAMAYLK